MKLYILILTLLIGTYAYAQPRISFKEFDLNHSIFNSSNSDPGSLASYNGKMFFAATTDTFDRELWVTDGTTTGTVLFKNLSSASSNPSYFQLCNGKIIFTADDGIYNTELWVSDGTPAGTQLLMDLCATCASAPRDFCAYNGKLYFTADTGFNDRELWVTDGTTGGTHMVKDINPAGTSVARQLYVYNGKLLFEANDGIHGNEPWISDGTAAGTHMLKDIYYGNNGSSLSGLQYKAYNGKLYFIADGSNYSGYELWVTDGTEAGTQMVKDICPGISTGLENTGIEYNGKLYFAGDDGHSGFELFVTDGTAAGTNLIKDLVKGPISSTPQDFFEYHNKLYFTAYDSTALRLYVTDGTDTGTRMIKGTWFPSDFVIYKDHIYFKGLRASNDVQLYVSDGTDTGTHLLAPPGTNAINPLRTTGGRGYLYVHDTTLFFGAKYNDDGVELWSLTDSNYYQPPADIPGQTTSIAMRIYPNPCKGSFTLSLPGYSATDNTTCTILDITGRQVYTQRIANAVTQVQAGNLPSGIYLLKLQQGTTVSVNRLMVE